MHDEPCAPAVTAALHDAHAAMADELRARTELFATTSHELRTPLNGILGMTQLILADPAVDGSVRERIALIHGAGEAMKALLDDILDLAKIEAGGEVDRVAFDLPTLIDEAARLWRPLAEGKGLTLDIDIDGAPRTIESDPARLRQILFNLLANALKFTDRGGVTVSARLAGADGSAALMLCVRDTGIGVAPAQQARIFDSFRQGDRSIARRYGGTGLGLAVCRRLAEAMGGTIALDSRAGEGSTFTVTLPLAGRNSRNLP